MEDHASFETSLITGHSIGDGLDLDWDSCVQMAGLLEQPPDVTIAIAEVLFRVNQDIASFDNLPLDSAEPATRFYAGWD